MSLNVLLQVSSSFVDTQRPDAGCLAGHLSCMRGESRHDRWPRMHDNRAQPGPGGAARILTYFSRIVIKMLFCVLYTYCYRILHVLCNYAQEQHDKEATTTSSLPATTDEEEVPPSSVCATEDEDEVLASQNEEHEEEEQQHVSSTSGEEPHPSTSMGSVSASLANDGTPPPRTRARMSTGPWWGR